MTKLKEIWIGFEPPKASDMMHGSSSDKPKEPVASKAEVVAQKALAEIASLCAVIEYRFILNKEQKKAKRKALAILVKKAHKAVVTMTNTLEIRFFGNRARKQKLRSAIAEASDLIQYICRGIERRIQAKRRGNSGDGFEALKTAESVASYAKFRVISMVDCVLERVLSVRSHKARLQLVIDNAIKLAKEMLAIVVERFWQFRLLREANHHFNTPEQTRLSQLRERMIASQQPAVASQ